ncbi:MAG: helix-turn-helix transcriptional regulator [Clostridia bacterium]|nr:helix-turn-helix transcriptional regulator [Clostridia bacterium]
MDYSIGKIIRKIRKEKNLTQEELAEQLYVTAQAVSKWENETGLPDITQIVPLCRVLGVSADELFGILGTNADEEVEKFIEESESYIGSTELDNEEEYDIVYKRCLEQLKLYPNNIKLLVYTLSCACIYAFKCKNNGNIKEAQETFNEAKREAKLIIQYGKSIHDIMTAHMWLIKLYCRFGMYDEAKKEAEYFPKSSDYTKGTQLAWIYCFENNTDEEIKARCNNFSSIITSLEHELIMLGNAYKRKSMYKDALDVYTTFLKTVKAIYKNEEYTPPLHTYQWIYMHIAHCYLELGDTEKAIDSLYNECEGLIAEAKHYNIKTKLENVPALKECEFSFCSTKMSVKEPMLSSLNKKWFDSIRNHPRFIALTEKVNTLE